MDRVAGPPRNGNAPGAHIRTPFEDRTLRLEDGDWTPGTDEDGIMSEWTEQHILLELTLPAGTSSPAEGVTCSCGSPYRFKGQMEFLYRGRYEYTHDAVCTGCGTRAAISTEAQVQ